MRSYLTGFNIYIQILYIYVIRFHTGDIVEMVGDKNFKIIDRIKNFFKLSQVNVVCCIAGFVDSFKI